MELEDRITIATPEGVEVQLQLAGAGSRFIAGCIDLALQLLLVLLTVLLTGGAGGAGVAVFAIAVFAIVYLYDVAFEVLARGRTPGKRLTHLRVVRDGGEPIDLRASAVRNMMRLLDGPPLVYLPTLVSVLLTARNQRPGDLAAGTLVIREAAREVAAPALIEPAGDDAGLDTAGWDISAVTVGEVAAVRRFLQRREELDDAPRRELAHRLEQGLRPKVAGAPPTLHPERFLEALVRAKARR